jgi:hypothetical protein
MLPKPLVHPDATPQEKDLHDLMYKANNEVDKLEKAIEAHFFPLIRTALNAGEVSTAHKILARMPDCVVKVFAMDMVRQAALKTIPSPERPALISLTAKERK